MTIAVLLCWPVTRCPLNVGTHHPSAHPVLGAVRPLPDGSLTAIRLAFVHSLDANGTINGFIGHLRQARRSSRSCGAAASPFALS